MIQRDGALTLEVGELLVTIDTPDGEFGDHLEAAISGSMPLEVVGQDNEIAINLGDADLAFMVRESDWGTDTNEVITNMLSAMLNPTVLMATIGRSASRSPHSQTRST